MTPRGRGEGSYGDMPPIGHKQTTLTSPSTNRMQMCKC